MWLRIIFLSVWVLSAAFSVHAAPDVSTSCSTVKGSFDAKQNGKTLKCTSKKTCKTTTCKMGVGYDCSVTTSTTLSDCSEVSPAPNAVILDGALIPFKSKGDVLLAPTKDKYKRFPSKITPREKEGSLAPATTTPVPTKQLPSSSKREQLSKPKVTVIRR
jgi:hypothetical protein